MDDIDLRGLLFAIAAATCIAMLPKPAFAIAPPAPESPPQAATIAQLGAFTWSAVKGAARYEFQISSDAGFGSIVNGAGPGRGHQKTNNTAATLAAQPPDGSFSWRVRSIDDTGHASAWSGVRSVVKRWDDKPTLLGPIDALAISWPQTPLVLRWTPAAHATSYNVTIATDPALANPLLRYRTAPINTQGTRYALPDTLAPGQYYWAVTPQDADGHPGKRSAIGSFTWTWPDEPAQRTVADLDTRPDFSDWEFAWLRVGGAVKYDVEINTHRDFPADGKWCCDQPTIGTVLSMKQKLNNNDYYWRVRAIDRNGNAGAWYEGPPVRSEFGGVQHLRLSDPEATLETDPNVRYFMPGDGTDAPVLTWDPVPGASSYEVRGGQYRNGHCDYASEPAFSDLTSTPAWTPLARDAGQLGSAAWPRPTVEYYKNLWTPSTPYFDWCLKVLARADRDARREEVIGTWAYVEGPDGTSAAPDLSGGAGEQAAFRWWMPPDPVLPIRDPFAGYADDLSGPIGGKVVHDQPLFTWHPIDGAACYYVVVSRDPEFRNVIDVAATNITAYAPRSGGVRPPISYADETQDKPVPYWWMVTPAEQGNCAGSGEVNTADAETFTYDSYRPQLRNPAPDEIVALQPTFRWSTVPGVRTFRLQISQDPKFGNLLDDVKTAATSYTTDSTLPADSRLYWRVRATGESGLGMNWSETRSFIRRLPGTTATDATLPSGADIPVLAWNPVLGATSYDVHVEEVDGDKVDGTVGSAAATPVLIEGTGVWTWSVRPRFPGMRGEVTGPWSPGYPFLRKLPAPTGLTATRTKTRTLLTWDPNPGATTYSVEVSPSNSFDRVVERAVVSTNAWAPQRSQGAYFAGGVFYWRVASRDHGHNVGAYAAGTFKLPRLLKWYGKRPELHRGKVTLVNITWKRGDGKPIKGVLVRFAGKGIKTIKRWTDKSGRIVVKITPKRIGKLTMSASKAGYERAYATLKVTK